MNLAFFGKFYFALFILFSAFNTFIKAIKLTKKQFIIIWVLFVISIGMIGLKFSPPSDWDVSRHFVLMNDIRASGIKLFDFLFNNRGNVGGNGLNMMLSFNLIRYLVAHITDNNFWLPTICGIIDYSILGYICMDWSFREYGYYKIDFITLLVSFGHLSFDGIFSGMRTALALSFAALGIYLYMVQKKRFAVLIVLFAIAVTIHPVSLITLMVVILFKMRLGKKAYLIVFLAFASFNVISQIFMNSSFAFLRYIGRKYYSYVITGESSMSMGRSSYVFFFCYILFLILFFLNYKNESEKKKYKEEIFNFLTLYIFFIILNIGTLEMFERPRVLIGFFAPVFSTLIMDLNAKGHIDKAIMTFFKLMILGLFFVRILIYFYNRRGIYF